MAEEVKIDKQVFQDRLSQFLSAWKTDKRSNDALFGGVGSIVIRLGKNEQTITLQKNNALHVSSDLQAFFYFFAEKVSSTDKLTHSSGFLVMSFRPPYCYLLPRPSIS